MFGHDSLPSCIYSYGAKAPTINAELVNAQMSAAHKYGNKLVEIELQRREATNALVRRLSPDLEAAEQAVADLDQRIKAVQAAIRLTNQSARKKGKGTPEQRAEIKELRTKRKEAAGRRKEAKALAYESLEAKAELGTINQATGQTMRDARAESEIYWGTYLQVEQAAGKNRSGPPPRFRRWTGDGKLAVQIQGGMTAEDAFAGKDKRFILEGDSKYAQAWIRIGSEGRQPVWAVVPVLMHRPIPDDCLIKWVYLIRRRVEAHHKWQLCLVLSRAGGWQKPDLARSGNVGIDFGWRLLDHGLRVAYWAGDDGQSGELVLPIRDVGRWQKADDLQSIRDERFNLALTSFREWLRAHELPDWLAERTKSVGQWRAQARLAALVIHWRGERFAGDEEIFAQIEAWRKKDKHLWTWEVNQRRKAVAWRVDLYRNFAATLSRQYRVAHIENTKWSDMAKRPTAEMEDDGNKASRRYRQIAAPGRLGKLIRERFAEVVKEEAAYTTQRCHACGELAQFDAATHLWTKCRHCGAEWDQDYNAAMNLLASGPVAQKTP